MYRVIQAFIALFVLATVASADGGPSIERGKVLFNSTTLGTNGKSCAGCRPDGKGLEEAAVYDEKRLAKISIQCIVKALNGKALADGSPELTSLVMYLKSFGTAKAK
jgi:hypothetical protein